MKFTTPQGKMVLFSTPPHRVVHFERTCLKESDKCLAGRFAYWNNLAKFYRDTSVLLQAEISNRIDTQPEEKRVEVVELQLPHPIGWPRIAKREDFKPEDLYQGQINGKVSGLIVKNEAVKAPPTNTLTFYCLIHPVKNEVVRTYMFDLFPGPRIEEFKGDITQRYGVVVFRLSHPGQPLPPSSPFLSRA